MPYLKERRLFISHAWDYSAHYNTVKEWLDELPYFTWSNYSIPIEKALDVNSKRELKQRITNKIEQIHCLIVFAGMYSAHSEWIDYEIDEAVRLGKPIIGVRPQAQERVPVKITTYANVMVYWNRNSLLEAIRQCTQ